MSSLNPLNSSKEFWRRIMFFGATALLFAFVTTSVIGFDYFLAEPNPFPHEQKFRAVKFYEIGAFLGLTSFLLFAILVFSLPKGWRKFYAIGAWVVFGLIIFLSLYQAIIMSILHAPH